MTTEFKKRVLEAMAAQRENYQGHNRAFAATLGISAAIYSRLRSGETEQLLSDGKWLQIARMMDVRLGEEKWVTARTEVYTKIENDLANCQQNSTALILVDECGIGKTFCARQIARTMRNTFYVDCSQAKTRLLFIAALAKAIGVETKGRYHEIKADIKYALLYMDKPLIILDEAGDLDYPAFLELKEMWNATEGACGWYMMGADGLRKKIEKGINHRKVGYREIFDRFNNKFMKAVPVGSENKEAFYTKLIGDVLMANLPASEQKKLNTLVKKVLATDSGEPGTLRRARTIVKLVKAA